MKEVEEEMHPTISSRWHGSSNHIASLADSTLYFVDSCEFTIEAVKFHFETRFSSQSLLLSAFLLSFHDLTKQS